MRIKTPTGVQFTTVAVGNEHSIAIGTDGNIYAWGKPEWGLGVELDAGFGCVPTPKRVPTPAGVQFTDVSANWSNSAAIGTDGNVYTWGFNGRGDLGDGTTTNRESPVKVSRAPLPAGERYTAISAGRNHMIALGSDGRIYSWGDNAYDQLGTGMPVNSQSQYRVTPGRVPQGELPVGERFTAISASPMHNIALATDGNAYAWGFNVAGELGDGTEGNPNGTPQEKRSANKYSPVKVKPGELPAGEHFTSVGAGTSLTMATGSDGNTYTWGRVLFVNNGGSVSNHVTPVRVERGALPTGEHFTSVYVSLSGEAVFAIGSDGHAYSWGGSVYGALGLAATTRSTVPAQVVTPRYIIFCVSIPSNSSCSTAKISEDPITKAWKIDVPQNDPEKVKVRVYYKINGIAADGTIHLGNGGSEVIFHYEYCGTYIVHYDLGEGKGEASGPADQAVVNDELMDWPQDPTWAGHQFTGWFKSDGSPWNLADPVTGPLTLYAHWDYYKFTISPASGPVTGNTPITISVNPKTTSLRFTQISAGTWHTLAIGSDGNTYAWGGNDYGQLGNTTTDQKTLPTRVQTPTGVHFIRISAGHDYSLALGDDHNVYSWGSNQYGQLGNTTNNGSTTPNPAPSKISGGSLAAGSITKISAGSTHAMALDGNGQIHTWGNNQYGQLGNATNNGITAANPTPATVTGGSLPASNSQISAGQEFSLSLDSQGHVHAWGHNMFGQLGHTINNGTTNPNPTPAQVDNGSLSSSTINQISAGSTHTVALDSEGRVHTWGRNMYGELGKTANNGSNNANPAPAVVTGGSLPVDSVTQISAGSWHSLALDDQGRIHAWGLNRTGQLGKAANSGNSNPNPRPALVGGGAPTSSNAQINAGGSHSIALDQNGNAQTWGLNFNGQLGDDTTSPPNNYRSQPKAITTNKISVNSVEFGDSSHAIAPTYDASNVQWHGNTPPHGDGLVPVKLKWSLNGSTQPVYTITPGFYYYVYLTLPTAGAIPLQRLTGSSLLLLTALAAAAYGVCEFNKRRKCKRAANCHRARNK
ncbi:hypothetical protein KIMH_01280 [Bombiscardovia apis]|uniref:RCC1-like domain-containing protein n=1 Tax=Bombiscardovia apis TaxID=2932182 RepID=A0ABN6SFH7_9BIFI|nr:hypothetical protein KIMH_01280 [Bombiscardovia apis]